MSFNYKYQKWIHECQQFLHKVQIQKIRRKRILSALLVNEILWRKKRRESSRRNFWIHPLFKLRTEHGFYEAVFPTLSSFPDKFENYLRMSSTQFEELLCLVGPVITKQNIVREPISAVARLLITLRYLATGDCFTSISYHYLVGESTTAIIIAETCRALWSCLKEEVLPYPLAESDWLRIANEFEEKWQFQHCIGAIDGKHIQIRCPDNAGSTYYNYKNHHSIVLLAVCDANYSFTLVDIGAYGRRSDGGIFRESEMGRKFERKEMSLPNPEKLTVDGMPLPYVLVGDEAFQLTDYLLRPYPGRSGLNQEKNIFNYRLSRARRMIENTFGIMVSQWRVMKRPMEGTVENITNAVQAIVCLHNWLRKRDEDNTYIPADINNEDVFTGISEQLRREVKENSALEDGRFRGINNSSRTAVTIRNEFCDFFNAEDAPSQPLKRRT